MTELERHKPIFNRIRKIEAEDDAMDQDLEDI
jgi:hypothetical protein